MEKELIKLKTLHKDIATRMEDKKRLNQEVEVIHAETKKLKQERTEVLKYLWKEVEAPISEIAKALDMTPDEAYAYIYQASWFMPRKQLKNV